MAKKNWKRIQLLAFVGLSSISFVFFQLSKDLSLFQNLDLDLYDIKLKQSFKTVESDPSIVVVSVDDRSLESLEGEFGRWPWKRSAWGHFLQAMRRAGANSVLFDIKFTEYTKAPVNGDLHPDDLNLFLGTTDFEKVTHVAQLTNEPETERNTHLLNLPLSSAVKALTLTNSSGVSVYNKAILPFAELTETANSIGLANIDPDPDGVYRRIQPLKSYGNHYFISLGFTPFLNFEKKFSFKRDRLGFQKTSLPLRNYEMMIPLHPNFKNYSASYIFAKMQDEESGDQVDWSEFKDKDVFVGATAVGLQDVKSTPLGIQPGVFLHASVLNALKNQKFISFASNVFVWFLVTLTVFLIVGVIVLQDDLLLKLGFFIFIVFLVIILDGLLFSNYYIWMPLGYVLPTLLFSFIISFIYKSLYENRDKRFLKAAFKNYISPELIEQIHLTGEMPTLGGEVGRRTAFFTDIANFSSFSEKLPPDKLVQLINEYLTHMTEILLEEGGTLDKFFGDAIVAFFGAPINQQDQEQRAARVALKMQLKLAELRRKWKREDRPDDICQMSMRIGINSGNILTGNMGAKGRMNYTMMGDAVNLAARLESSAKQFGVLVHIGENTASSLDDSFLLRRLDKIVVKGKSEPVVTYELLNSENQQLKDLVVQFEEGLSHYEKREFEQAISCFEKSLLLEGLRNAGIVEVRNPSQIYIERCLGYIDSPPPADWHGVFVLSSK